MPNGGVLALKQQPRNRNYTITELSDLADKHDKMLTEIYPVSAIITKVWTYLKYATPAMVLAMLGNINPDSFVGKAITLAWQKVTNG